MIRLVAFLILFPFAAIAQDWPTLHSVVGVSDNDSLNVRAAPDATSDIIGQLASNHTNVEVVAKSADGRWGQINSGEQSGWVSLRYLSEPVTRNATQLPLACFGTEPFWSLEIAKDGKAVFENLDSDSIRTSEAKTIPSANNTTRISIIGEDARSQTGLALFYRTQTCSDGMSDRRFGISVDVVVGPPVGEPMALSGCCILTP